MALPHVLQQAAVRTAAITPVHPGWTHGRKIRGQRITNSCCWLPMTVCGLPKVSGGTWPSAMLSGVRMSSAWLGVGPGRRHEPAGTRAPLAGLRTKIHRFVAARHASRLLTRPPAVPARRRCLLWRETGPQHFASPTGTFRHQRDHKDKGWYYSGGCVPHRDPSLASPWEPVHRTLEARFSIPVVRVWNASRMHWDKHVANRTKHTLGLNGFFDCTHWCTPGVADVWVSLLLEAVARHCPPRVDVGRETYRLPPCDGRLRHATSRDS